MTFSLNDPRARDLMKSLDHLVFAGSDWPEVRRALFGAHVEMAEAALMLSRTDLYEDRNSLHRRMLVARRDLFKALHHLSELQLEARQTESGGINPCRFDLGQMP